MSDIASRAIEEAKARAKADEAEVPDFIKAKKQGNGQAAKWFEGSKPGMVFKNGSHGAGVLQGSTIQDDRIGP